MPRISRENYEGIVCHHMVQGINREMIFNENEEKNNYYGLLKKFYIKYGIDIIAYCIMDNHVHLILYSKDIKNISNFMKMVNLKYALYYNKKHDRVGYVFRNRFNSKPILSTRQLYTCIKYIHMNPVKAGIVKKEEDYIYSSYKDYLNKSGFLNQKILKFIFGEAENYLNVFKSIPYETNLEEKREIEDIINEFISNKKILLSELLSNKNLIQEFINYLYSNQIEFSKTQLSQILKISQANLYRKIKIAKGEEKSGGI